MNKKKPSSPKKHTSGAKKKSTSGKKAAKNAEPFISKYPPIDIQKILEVPEINVVLKYDQNRAESFEMKLPINMTLRKIIEKINERNGNALHHIRIFFFENSVKKYMDNFTYQTLKQIGLKPGENLLLFYEYEPAVHPLLETCYV